MVWLCFFLHQSRDNLVVPKPALTCMVTPAPGDYGHVVKIQIQFLDCPGPISSGARGCPSAHHPCRTAQSQFHWMVLGDRQTARLPDCPRSHKPKPRSDTPNDTTFRGYMELYLSKLSPMPWRLARGWRRDTHSSLNAPRSCRDTHTHHHNQIYYSNGTDTAGDAHGDIAQGFLPASFCPKRPVYLPVLSSREEKSTLFYPNKPLNALKIFFGHFEFPSEMEKKKTALSIPSCLPLPAK